MDHQLYISDRMPRFHAHLSLNEPPTVFETKIVTGCVFYLPSEGRRGGDTFTITEGSYFTVGLLGDMAGHGNEGRARLAKIHTTLDELSTLAASEGFDKRDISRKIAEFDGQVSFESMFALSFARILNDRTICYLNEGENQILICKSGCVYNPSERISHGKIGLLKVVVGSKEDIERAIRPEHDQLSPGDKLILCSDGVYDFPITEERAKLRMRDIEAALALDAPIAQIVALLNQSALRELEEAGMKRISDDYTIVGIQIK